MVLVAPYQVFKVTLFFNHLNDNIQNINRVFKLEVNILLDILNQCLKRYQNSFNYLLMEVKH